MFCINCGKKIEDDSEFCQFCDVKITSEKEDRNYPPEVPNKYRREYVSYLGRQDKRKRYVNIKRFSSNHWRKLLVLIIASFLIWGIVSDNGIESREFPQLIEPRTLIYEWEYKGAQYSITETLYGSVYEYYSLSPEKEFYEGMDENSYLMNFLLKSEALEDDTISKIAQDIKLKANKRNLSDDELVELIIAFVQFIPYDDDKLAIIESEYTTEKEKTWPRFPYEVLYENKGVCSGKTLLTIALLKKIGYGTAIFEFDNEMHMAPAVKCTKKYSSYDSGYCFAEVVEAGYKIGEISQMEIGAGKPKSRSLIDLFDSGQKRRRQNLSELKDVEITGTTDGKSYEGIIATIQAIKKIEELDIKLINLDYSLELLEQELTELENDVDYYDRLADEAYARHTAWEDYESYREYERLYSQYESAYSRHKSKYNYCEREINKYNNLVKEYNSLIENW